MDLLLPSLITRDYVWGAAVAGDPRCVSWEGCTIAKNIINQQLWRVELPWTTNFNAHTAALALLSISIRFRSFGNAQRAVPAHIGETDTARLSAKCWTAKRRYHEHIMTNLAQKSDRGGIRLIPSDSDQIKDELLAVAAASW